MYGTYESTLSLRIPAADALIVIEQSRLTCLWRIIERKLPSMICVDRMRHQAKSLIWRFFATSGDIQP